MKRYTFAIIVAVLILAGCTTPIQDAYIKKSDVETQIAALVVKHQQELDAAVSNISAKKDDVIVAKDFQLQTVADSLYGANLAFNFYTTPGRIDLIINNRVKEADAATGKKATPEAMERENKRLAEELDETKTSLADLQNKHIAVVKENTVLADKTTKLEDDLKKALLDIETMKTTHANELIAKQNELIASQNKINILEKKRSDDAVFIQKTKMKIVSVLGILSIAAFVAAVYFPVARGKTATIGAIAAAGAAGVLYLQAWMVMAGMSILLLVVGFFVLRELALKKKVVGNLVGAIEEVKQIDPMKVKTTLKDWNSKVTGDGKKVVDASVEAEIQAVRVEQNHY